MELLQEFQVYRIVYWLTVFQTIFGVVFMKSAFLISVPILSAIALGISPAIASDLVPVSSNPLQAQSAPSRRVKISQMMGRGSIEAELLRLTNIERQKAGLPALKLSPKLSKAAQSHAVDMAKNNYFNHTGKNGSSMASRVSLTAYPYSFLGENIAAGLATADGTIRQWMNSSGHRKNILNRNFTEIGFGYANSPSSEYTHYWVQVFGTPQR